MVGPACNQDSELPKVPPACVAAPGASSYAPAVTERWKARRERAGLLPGRRLLLSDALRVEVVDCVTLEAPACCRNLSRYIASTKIRPVDQYLGSVPVDECANLAQSV